MAWRMDLGLSKTIKSLYFDDADIKRYTVFVLYLIWGCDEVMDCDLISDEGVPSESEEERRAQEARAAKLRQLIGEYLPLWYMVGVTRKGP